MRAAPGRSHTRGMSEVRVNGVSLYYEEHGAGEPIVGLHGAGSSAAMWIEAAPELAKRGRTILYDRRGSFRSERPEAYATNVHEQADDAAALIDALAAAPAILIGRSYGGAIAVDLTLRYPDRVRALVLLEGDVPLVSETAANECGRARAAELHGRARPEARRRGVDARGRWAIRAGMGCPRRSRRSSPLTALRLSPRFAAAIPT